LTLKELIARVTRAMPTVPPSSYGTNDIIDLLNEAQLNLARLSNKTSTSLIELSETTYSGVVNVDSKTVTWVSGDKFDMSWRGAITIDGETYYISYVKDTENLVLTAVADTGNNLVYEIDVIPDRMDFPNDMYMISTIYYGEDKKELSPAIGKLEYETITDNDNTSEPTNFYIRGSEIILRPRPVTEDIAWISYIPKPTILENDTDEPDLSGADEYMIAYALYRIYLEANSPSFQLWDLEMSRTLNIFMETSDQNYQQPFGGKLLW
jgi:hypothetical protein